MWNQIFGRKNSDFQKKKKMKKKNDFLIFRNIVESQGVSARRAQKTSQAGLEDCKLEVGDSSVVIFQYHGIYPY